MPGTVRPRRAGGHGAVRGGRSDSAQLNPTKPMALYNTRETISFFQQCAPPPATDDAFEPHPPDPENRRRHPGAGGAGGRGHRGDRPAHAAVYDTTATSQHLQPCTRCWNWACAIRCATTRSEVAVPPLGAPQQVQRGAAVYAAHCAQCHGGPGSAQAKIGQSMQPLPGPLVDASARWQPRELYWITKHGIKMSGMPAWQFHLSDADLWAVVSFMGVLPTLSARDYAQATGSRTWRKRRPRRPPRPEPPMSARLLVCALALLAGCQGKPPPAGIQGDPARGRVALAQYACRACHMIPGVTGPEDLCRAPAGRPGRAPLHRRQPAEHPGQPGALDPRSASRSTRRRRCRPWA